MCSRPIRQHLCDHILVKAAAVAGVCVGAMCYADTAY
jgi:hypothetical protein